MTARIGTPGTYRLRAFAYHPLVDLLNVATDRVTRETLARSPRRRANLPVALAAVCALLPTLAPPVARADAAGVVNALRAAGCARKPAPAQSLQQDGRLDLVARELARGLALEDAIASANYPADGAASLRLRGSGGDAELRSALSGRYCDSVSNPAYNEIGVYEAREELWIVLAFRRPERPALEPPAVAEEVLTLVNAARAEPRRCGRERFDAAPPLRLSRILNAAAEGHAWDMAARGRAGHDGSDGSDSGQRITRAGYTWRAAGENVAAGQPDAGAVVRAWLESPGHCASLMAPWFTETGIAFAEAPSKNPSIYWTQVFAAPR